MADTDEQTRHRAMLERALARHGLEAESWIDRDADNDNRPTARISGRWNVVDDIEHEGLYEGDEGTLTATVVGAAEHGNEHVAFYFTLDGADEAIGQVTPGIEVEEL